MVWVALFNEEEDSAAGSVVSREPDATIARVTAVFVVTGGAGFIGSHLAERLLRDHPRARVRILDNFSSGSLDNLPFAAAANGRLSRLPMEKLSRIRTRACG